MCCFGWAQRLWFFACYTAPVERRDKEESNWIKVDQLIKAGESGRPTRGGFNLHRDNRESQATNIRR